MLDNKRIKTGKPTIATIAEMVGVHKSTVSRVLSSKKKNDDKVSISDSRRKQILDAARKLNYKPNLLAKALSTQRTKTIGAVGELGSPYFYTMLLHAQKAASEKGYILSVHGTDSYDSVTQALDDMAKLWQYDGIWAVGSDPEYQQLIVAHCEEHNIPLVVVGQPLACEGAAHVKSVGGDLTRGFSTMLDYLRGIGHQRYVWFVPELDCSALGALYHEAILNACQAAGIGDSQNTFISIAAATNGAQTRQITKNYFAKLSSDERPSAAISIFETVPVMNGILDAGFSVPGDISFITVDYAIETYGESLRPPVAALFEPNDLFGRRSVDLLIDMIEKGSLEQMPFEHVSLPLDFSENLSCKPLIE